MHGKLAGRDHVFVLRPRQGFAARARRGELLDRGFESKLTPISAPAGFGKATMLTKWANATAANAGRCVPMGK